MRLAAAEGGLQLDDGLAAGPAQTAQGALEQVGQAGSDEGALVEEGGIGVLSRTIAPRSPKSVTSPGARWVIIENGLECATLTEALAWIAETVGIV